MKVDRFLGFFLLDLLVSKQFHTCQDKPGTALLIFHHLISVAFWWNFLVGVMNPILHTVAMLTIVGMWFLSIGDVQGCFITRINNRLCGFQNSDTLSNVQGYVLGTKMSTHLALSGVLLVINFHLYRSGKTTLF